MWQAPQRNANAIWPNRAYCCYNKSGPHETFAVPFLSRLSVEVRVWEQAVSENAGRFAVNFFIDSGWLRLWLLIEPQSKFVRLGRSARARARSRQAQNLETLAAWILTVIEHLQRSINPKLSWAALIPEMLIASAPKIPGVAST